MKHRLKMDPQFFDAVRDGLKTFEVRRDDRGGFNAGDTLELVEWPGSRTQTVRVRYVLRDAERFGVAAGFVVMSVVPE